MKKTVTMTDEQWTNLTTYLLMTTQHRHRQRKTWEKLASETDEDGKPLYPNAPGNAKYWAEWEQELTEIIKIIDRTQLQDD